MADPDKTGQPDSAEDAQRAVARSFLTDLFPVMPSPSVIVVGTIKSPHYALSVDDALVWVAGKRDRYVRTSLLAGRPERGRGRERDSIAIPGLTADLDVNGSPDGQGGVVQGAFASFEDALAFAHEHKPTLIVRSGYGLQPWWLFSELIMLTSDADREHAKTVARGWLEHLRQAAGVSKFDAVADLARLMRVPGSLNGKGEVPVPVQLVTSGGPHYRFAQLELAGAPVPVRPRATGAVISADSVDVSAILVAHPIIAALVRREGKAPGDGSPSVWDWALAKETARSGYAPEAAAALIRHSRKLHGEGKGEREDYVEATVGKAYAETAQPEDRRCLGLSVGAAWNLGAEDPIIGGRMSGPNNDAFVELYRASGKVLRPGHVNALFSPTSHARIVSGLTHTRFKMTQAKALDIAQMVIQLCDDDTYDGWAERVAMWTGSLLASATVLDVQMNTPAGRWAALAASMEEHRKNDRTPVVLRDETDAHWIPTQALRLSLVPGAPSYGELDAIMEAHGWRRAKVDMHEPGASRKTAGRLKLTYYVEPSV